MIDLIMENMELKKRILIVNSDERQINRIEKQIAEAAVLFNRKLQIYKANDILEADTILVDNDIDILILDVVYRGAPLEEMPGIYFVEKLRAKKKYSTLPVIFIASIEKPKGYAYKELNCLAYFSRTFDKDAFRRIIEKAFQYTTVVEEKCIILKRNTVLYPVKLKDIVYIESENKILHLHLIPNGLLEISNKSLVGLCRETGNEFFVFCNKSTIVNKIYIKEIRLDEGMPYLIITDENIRIPIGGRYIKRIEELKLD